MASVFGMPLVPSIHSNFQQQKLLVNSLKYIVPTHNSMKTSPSNISREIKDAGEATAAGSLMMHS